MTLRHLGTHKFDAIKIGQQALNITLDGYRFNPSVLDGYARVPDTSATGDGYIAFFTGVGRNLAGDNDLYWNRATNQLTLNSNLLIYHNGVDASILTTLGHINLAPQDGYVTPAVDDAYSLGSPTRRWREVWIGPNSLHIYQPASIGPERDWSLRLNSGDFVIKQSISRFMLLSEGSGGPIAIGRQSLAFANSVAIGSDGTSSTQAGTASTGFAVAIGTAARAFSDRTVAVGMQSGTNLTTATDSTSVGYSAAASGASSTAIGASSSASADDSTVVGYSAASNSIRTVAVGRGAAANFIDATVVGANAGASGIQASTFGQGAASGQDGVAVGYNASLTVNDGVSIGSGSSVAATRGIVIGKDTSVSSAATGSSIAIGYTISTSSPSTVAIGGTIGTGADNSTLVGVGASIIVDALRATAIGSSAAATATDAVAVGKSAFATASQATALGTSSTASGVEATAVGYLASAIAAATAVGSGATASGGTAVAFGDSSVASGLNSVALGTVATAAATRSIAIGRSATINSLATDSILLSTSASTLGASASNTLFINTGNARTVNANGLVVIGSIAGTLTNTQSVFIGYNMTLGTSTTYNDCVAIGYSTTIGGTQAIAIGGSANASGTNVIAIGDGATGTGTAGFAFGAVSDAGSSDWNIAIGVLSKTQSGQHNTVVGHISTSAGADATLLGYNIVSAASNTVVIGSGASATGLSGIAVGKGAIIAGASSIAIGSNATTGSYTNSLAIGENAVASDNNQAQFGTLAQPLNFITYGSITLGSATGGNLSLRHNGIDSYIQTSAGHIILAPKDGYVVPFTDDAYSLGSQTQRWKELWLGGNSLHLYKPNDSQGIERDWSLRIGSAGAFVIKQSNDQGLLITPQATGSVALGYGASVALGQFHTAIGSGASASSVNGSNLAIGYNAVITNAASTAVAMGANSSIGSSASSSVAIGYAATTTASNTTVIGYLASADASSNQGIAIGYNTMVAGANAIAIGSSAPAIASGAIAIGVGTGGAGSNSIAIGTGTANGSTDAVAIGTGAGISANQGIAIGTSSSSLSSIGNGTGSIAIGYTASADGGGIAIGYLATANYTQSHKSIAIGYNATTLNFINSLAVGENARPALNNQAQFGTLSKTMNTVIYGSLILNKNSKMIVLEHNGSDGYLETTAGHLILAPADGEVVPAGDGYGFGNPNNRWYDGYFTDINTRGLVTDIVTIISANSPYTAKQSNYTILANAVDGNITVNLPGAGDGNLGRMYNIKKIDSSGNTVTIQGSGAQNIDNSNTNVINTQYTSRTIQSDGFNWWII